MCEHEIVCAALRDPSRSLKFWPQPKDRAASLVALSQHVPQLEHAAIEDIWHRVLSNLSGFSCLSTRRGRYASANKP